MQCPKRANGRSSKGSTCGTMASAAAAMLSSGCSPIRRPRPGRLMAMTSTQSGRRRTSGDRPQGPPPAYGKQKSRQPGISAGSAPHSHAEVSASSGGSCRPGRAGMVLGRGAVSECLEQRLRERRHRVAVQQLGHRHRKTQRLQPILDLDRHQRVGAERGQGPRRVRSVATSMRKTCAMMFRTVSSATCAWPCGVAAESSLRAGRSRSAV